jgi:hypothetical protein
MFTELPLTNIPATLAPSVATNNIDRPSFSTVDAITVYSLTTCNVNCTTRGSHIGHVTCSNGNAATVSQKTRSNTDDDVASRAGSRASGYQEK